MGVALIEPGAAGWDAARAAYNLAVDQRPALVALPRDAAEVAAAIAVARDRGLRVAAQRTGHNAAPLGDLSDTLLLRTDGLGGVEIDARRRTARAGAGALWGDVVPAAAAHGLAALHGSSPTVGVAGYSLGGGLSWYARRHGLQSGSVTAVELVTADGALVRADEERAPDLLWALRGGGGSFGAVTAIEFRLYPAPQLYAGMMLFPLDRGLEALQAWRALQDVAPDELTAVARVMHFPPIDDVPEPMRGGSFVVVDAVLMGSEREGDELLRPLRSLRPQLDTFAAVAPAGVAPLHMDPPDPIPYASEHALAGSLPDLEAVLEVARAPLAFVELRPLGGALSRPGAAPGARTALPGEYLMFAAGMTPDAASAEAVAEALAQVREAFAPHAVARYLNYVEAPADPRTLFDAATYERLRAVKAAYDPGDLFRANHPVTAMAVV